MEKLECKYCGNNNHFYIKETYKGYSEVEVNNKGEIDDTCINTGMYDHPISKLKSVFYYCSECNRKVAKIPPEKRY